MAKTNRTGTPIHKLTGQEQVAEFLGKLVHPLKQEIEEVRAIIMLADPQLTEHIKWNAPSFQIMNDDRITFNLQGKGFFRIIFHCGAKKSDLGTSGPVIDDDTTLLEWAANDRAIMKFSDRQDVEAKRDQLIQIVTKWIEATSPSVK